MTLPEKEIKYCPYCGPVSWKGCRRWNTAGSALTVSVERTRRSAKKNGHPNSERIIAQLKAIQKQYPDCPFTFE